MSIANPIIRRELIGVLRTRRALLIQVALVVALGGVVLLMWPDNDAVAAGSAGTAEGHESLQLFRTFTYGLLVCMLLLSPVFPATTIVRERQSGTLQLLLTSRLSPLSVVFGKIAAAVGFILVLLTLSMPAAAACYAMKNIDFFDQVVKGYVILGLCAVQYALVGLLISSYARTSDAALRMTYGAVLGMSVLTVLPYQVLHAKITGPIDTALGWVYAVSPIPAIMKVLRAEDMASQGVSMTAGMQHTGWLSDNVMVVRYIVLALVSIVVCTVWLVIRLQPSMLDRSKPAGRITDDRSAGARWFRRIMFLGGFDPQRREQFIGLRPGALMVSAIGFAVASAASAGAFVYAQNSGLADGGMGGQLMAALLACAPAMAAIMFGFSFAMNAMQANPVIAKEFRSRALGRSHWMMRLIAAVLIVSLGLTLAVATLSQQTSGMGFLGGVLVIFQMGLVLLVGPSLATALISSELESGGWELLQMTRLRAWQIVLGKLISAAWTLVLLLVATVPGYVALLIIDSGFQDRVFGVLIGLSLTALFTVLLSAACSSLFRRTTAATSVSYMIIVVLCVGTLVPWLGEGMLFGHALVESILRFNPVAAALSIIDMPGLSREAYQLTPFNWQFLAIASGVCAIVLWLRTWHLTRPS
jgi:ABC-type transport system involved in multi-copper enzyme maturation permease subunit